MKIGRNEIEQIAFRLAKRLNLPTLYGIDFQMFANGMTPSEMELPNLRSPPRPDQYKKYLAYSAFNRCPPPNFMASAPTMRPIGSAARSRSRTSKQMCQPAAPHEMKRRSTLCRLLSSAILGITSSTIFHGTRAALHLYFHDIWRRGMVMIWTIWCLRTSLRNHLTGNLYRLAALLAGAALLWPSLLLAAPVAVRHMEGLVHGFLALSTLDGKTLAVGDLSQVARGEQVTTHLVFRFNDGSLRDETAVFSQRRNFRLLSYHLVQKGPAFQHPMEVAIDTSTGQVTVNYTDEDKEKVATDRLELPPDVANGMLFTLLKNIRSDGPPTTFSMVSATPKPRLVRLAVNPQGEEPFTIGGSKRKAMHYVLKVEIGGVAGVVAPIVRKQPPDIHVWILGGEAPAFVKSEGPLYLGGPIWRIELVSPVWP